MRFGLNILTYVNYVNIHRIMEQHAVKLTLLSIINFLIRYHYILGGQQHLEQHFFIGSRAHKQKEFFDRGFGFVGYHRCSYLINENSTTNQ